MKIKSNARGIIEKATITTACCPSLLFNHLRRLNGFFGFAAIWDDAIAQPPPFLSNNKSFHNDFFSQYEPGSTAPRPIVWGIYHNYLRAFPLCCILRISKVLQFLKLPVHRSKPLSTQQLIHHKVFQHLLLQ